MEKIRCNICDEIISDVAGHVSGRNHGVKKKVAEFQEMNALVSKAYNQDTSVLKAWIRDLHGYDYLSTGRT